MHGRLLAQLRRQFGCLPTVTFEQDSGGLIVARVINELASGTLYLHGAHVTQFQPAGQHELLFMSAASHFAEGKPIRGGVPVCFPWFGPKPGDPDAPAHGLARTRSWEIVAAEQIGGGTRLALATSFEEFDVRYEVTFGETLELTFCVTNASNSPASFEAALHSYFQISHVDNVQIRGLETVAFLDQLTGTDMAAAGAPIRFLEETDRIYFDTDAPIVLEDSGLKRRIFIERSEAPSVIVWNPWTEKSKRMPDFGDDEWRSMCCIESASVRRNTVTLEPGSSFQLVTKHRAESMS